MREKLEHLVIHKSLLGLGELEAKLPREVTLFGVIMGAICAFYAFVGFMIADAAHPFLFSYTGILGILSLLAFWKGNVWCNQFRFKRVCRKEKHLDLVKVKDLLECVEAHNQKYKDFQNSLNNADFSILGADAKEHLEELIENHCTHLAHDKEKLEGEARTMLAVFKVNELLSQAHASYEANLKISPEIETPRDSNDHEAILKSRAAIEISRIGG